MAEPETPTAAAPAAQALKGLCPHCASKTLFAGLTRFADRCPVCDLDFSAFNVGDGPAAFLTLILGAVIVAMAITLEVTVAPPFWVHILLWVPVTSISVIWSLRVAKAALLAAEYRNAAREGRIANREP